MKPPPFDYAEPTTIDEAVGVLAGDEDARPLAGGQSLVPMLNFRLAYPTILVGLRRLPSLTTIESRDGEISIGAMATQRDALASPAVTVGCPLVHRALRHIGHPQIRARGTVGGSLAHADPAAELPAVLLALDGSVAVRGPSGTRVIPARDLFLGHYTTSLEAGEIIVAARFPAVRSRTGAVCLELTRRPGDFAMAGVACQLSLAPDGSIGDARVVLFAVSDAPLRLDAVERTLVGAKPGEEAWSAAAGLATAGWAEHAGNSDNRDNSENGRYRQRVVPHILRRALAEAAGQAAEQAKGSI